MFNLQPAGQNCYKVEKQGRMKADVLVYLNKTLFENYCDDKSIEQLIDAASLPGVISPVIGMPDIHTGFGLPIGGVMAMDPVNGLISAGAVGMDINCGVRLLQTNIAAKEVNKDTLKKLIRAIGNRVPSGVGEKSKHAALIKSHFHRLVHKGVPYLVELGFGRSEDVDVIESRGWMDGADMAAVSKKAEERGLQLSTIGGGNHFVEIGYVNKVFDQALASAMNIQIGQLTVLIHTGSRGFGHQICTDYSAVMKKAAKKYDLDIPSDGLASVPVSSGEGKEYFAAMACAINFAFCNRQWITDDVRKAFISAMGGSEREYGLDLVYDLAHNTARFDTVGDRKMLIHRKGATRALPPGHADNPKRYLTTGHPVLIPGSMGSLSYIVTACPGVETIFNSVNHGAGRVLSRRAAKRNITVDDFRKELGEVIVSGANYHSYLDEAPQAYKDIDMVIDTFTEIDMIKKVASLKPLAVLKGAGND